MNSLLAPMYATEKKVPAFAFVIMQKKKKCSTQTKLSKENKSQNVK